MTMGDGQPFQKWMGNIKAFIDDNKNVEGLAKEFANMEKAYNCAEEVMNLIYSWHANKAEKGQLINVFAIRTLFIFAQLYVAMCLLDQALTVKKTIADLPADHYDMNFYNGKLAAARYYANNILPNVFTLTTVIKDADTSVLEVPEEALIIN
jgi:hypothetical protein